MIRTPGQHQTDPAKAAGQIVNPAGFSDAYTQAAINRARGIPLDESLKSIAGAEPRRSGVEVRELHGLPIEFMADVEQRMSLMNYPY